MGIEGGMKKREAPRLVFVSSVMDRAMAPWRTATREVLDSPRFSFLDPWIFEDAPASTQDLSTAYLDAVRRSALLILLIGSRMTPAVLAELDAAREHHVPILAYVLKVKRRAREAKNLISSLETKYGPVSALEADSLARYREALEAALHNETARRWDKRPGESSMQRLDLLGSQSLARCIARWQGAGLPLAEAERLARDETVGAPEESLTKQLHSGCPVVILGDLGSGKSLTAERIHQAAIREAAADPQARQPIYLEADDVGPRLRQRVEAKCAELERARAVGIALVVDDASRLPVADAKRLLHEARVLAHSSPQSSVVLTSRYVAGVFTPEIEDAYLTPPLTNNESAALMSRAAGTPIRDLSGLPPSVQTAVQRPLFAILAGTYYHSCETDRDYSPISLLSALVERSLDDPLTLSLEKALRRLAVLAVDNGRAWLPVRDVGDDRDLAALRWSTLTKERDGEVSFSLPILAEWFAAKSLGSGDPSVEDLLSEPSRLERWAYPLMLAAGQWEHKEAWALIETLVLTHPEMAARAISEGLPESLSSPASRPTAESIAVGNELRRSMEVWATALAPLSERIARVREGGGAMTVGVRRQGEKLEIGWYRPDDLPPVVDLPDSCGFMTLGPGWVAVRSASPGKGAIWAWQWILQDILARLDQVTLKRRLELDQGPYLREAAWATALVLLKHQLVHLGALQRSVLEEKVAGMGPNWFISRLGKEYRLGPLLLVLDELRENGEADVSDPWPHPGLVMNVFKPDWTSQTKQRLQERLGHVLVGALDVYADLVSTWFPALAKRLNLAALLPVRITVEVAPPADDTPTSAPFMNYKFQPLASGRSSCADVSILHGREALDPTAAQREYRQELNALQQLRPESADWASPLSYGHCAVLFRSPATALAYYWLRRDLHSIGWLPKQPHLTELTM